MDVIAKPGDKNESLAPSSHLVHRKGTTLNGVGTSTTGGKLKIPMAIRLQESDMVTLEYVHPPEIPEKTHS